MAAGSSANYGTLCVQVMDGNNTIRDAYDMQTSDEKIGLEAKLNVILSLLDPSSSEDFTTAVSDFINLFRPSVGHDLIIYPGRTKGCVGEKFLKY